MSGRYTRSGYRALIREHQESLKAMATKCATDLRRLKTKYWLNRANQLEKEGQILLAKAAAARERHQELCVNKDQIAIDKEQYLLKSGCCHHILKLKGKMAATICAMEPKDAIEFFVAVAHNQPAKAELIARRSCERRNM